MDAASPVGAALALTLQSAGTAASALVLSPTTSIPAGTQMSDHMQQTQTAVVAGAAAVLHTSAAAAIIMASTRCPRRWWMRPRSTAWWDGFVMSDSSDEQWRLFFRMPRALFYRLVEELRPELEKADTVMRRAIPVEKKVATALWVLAHRESYKQTGQRFGVGAATAREVLVDFALAMRKQMLPRTVYLGNVHEIMDGFAELGFPQVVGAVDGCRCLIVPPLRQREQFANRTDSYSILVQGTCDHTGRFVDVEIGGIHKARVICNSAIFKTMEAGTFVPGNPTITMCGQQIGPLLLSDSDHPIRKWLMKPYQGASDGKERLFNENLNRAKKVAERAFDRLKARWRFLTAPLHVSKENLIPIVTSCVVLHNLCETKGRVLDEDHHYRRHSVLPSPRAPSMGDEDQKRLEGEAVREALAQFFHTGRM